MMVSVNKIQFCAVALVVNSVLFSTAMAQKSTEKDEPAGSVQDRSVKQFVQRALKANDEDGDGKITKDEAKQLLRKNFSNVDADKDGVVTAEELAALARRINGRRTRQNPSNNRTAVPDNVTFKANIPYREGNDKWKLDLARTKTTSSVPQPAIVFIHGGGWRSGDKGGGQWRSLPLEYASRGYVCVSVNYRLTDEATILDCIADCKCAVRWLRANAEKYNVDPNRIGAYGNSAGAHLVSILGLASAKADLEGDGPFQDESSLVQAVCCSAPPADFMNWNKKSKKSETAFSRLFGAKDVEESKRRASPVTYAFEKAPPFLIVHGTADTTVPVAQGDTLERALKEAGAKDVTYMKFEGAGHGVFLQHRDETQPAMQKFFYRVLRKKN
jgi:acetyl esterase/lipase